MFDIRRYTKADEEQWNGYAEKAKNATFLFDRSYMNYHEDRFNDYSLMFYKDEKLYAMLPAHRVDDTLYSHFGLTYGGLIMDQQVRTADSSCCLKSLTNTFAIMDSSKWCTVPHLLSIT